MLEHYSNQAAGLLGLASQPGPRMLAMVCHGDDRAELPLLWQLCLALVGFGYPVTVLDATTAESDSNPGLEQLMTNTHWPDDHRHDAPAWTVMPSANGLQSLCAAPASQGKALQQLARLLAADGVIILYCKVEWIVALAGNSCIEPVLAVSPVKTSLLSSYVALKRMLITGNLKPTIVNMIQGNASAPTAHPASAGLSDCARKFLDHDIRTVDITEKSGDLPPDGDIQRLALRLLESSVELRAEYAPMNAFGRATRMDHAQQQGEMH